jgi:hypothetical protein
MKLAIIALALVSSSAFAARPDTTKMTCADAKELVSRNGAIVLSTGDGQYDRYVAGNGYIGNGEKLVASYVPTLDNAECFVGYVVRDSEFSGSNIVKAKAICKAGSEQYIPDSYTNSSGKSVGEWMVCSNGKWVSKFSRPAAPARKKCTDGALSTGWETITNGQGESVDVPYQAICKAGRWVKNN